LKVSGSISADTSFLIWRPNDFQVFHLTQNNTTATNLISLVSEVVRIVPNVKNIMTGPKAENNSIVAIGFRKILLLVLEKHKYAEIVAPIDWYATP